MGEIQNKKYILWDNDGVLVDTEKWYYEANKKALSEIGISFSLDEYMLHMQKGTSIWSLADDNKIDKETIKLQRKKRNQYYQEFLKTREIEIPEVISVLDELSKYYSMAIVTTSKKEDFELIHQGRNILKYMEFCLTLEDYEKAKPSPDPYLKGMESFKALPEECLVIEDSARGLKAALAAGIDCVIVGNEFTRTHDFTGAKQVVASTEELISLLL